MVKESVRGKRLGRYRLLEHLASGGMAEIYLGRREDEGDFAKDLVLKVLQERFAEHKQVVAMFEEEARLGAALRHPNIVDVYDSGEDQGVRFIAMEYIEGRTLTELLTRSFEVADPLPRGLAVHIAAEVAAGLAYLQDGLPGRGRAPGIVHRDISPTNIVIGWAGQTKIIDFGIAQKGQGAVSKRAQAAAAATEDGARPGKVSYMSPEQVKGEPLDGRSDIFSLGTILYEITLGKRLWRGPAPLVMRRIVEESPAPPTYVQRDYPPGLERIVLRALEKRPQDRYASAAELLRELDKFATDAGLPRGARLLGDYTRGLYAPGVEVSEGGVRRAQVFQDDEGVIDPELAPLDFDRAKPGSGAALAHALRGAKPVELAAEVAARATSGQSPLAAGDGAGGPGALGLAPRTPTPIPLRAASNALTREQPGPDGASALNSPSSSRSAAATNDPPPGAVERIAAPATSENPALGPAPGRTFVLIGIVLTILLGGLFLALRGP